MRPLPRPVLATAREQHGLVTADDLRIAGFSKRSRQEAMASGLLAPVHRGVFVLTSHPESFEQRALAACLAAPEAVLSGPTAGRWLGLRKVATNDVHVLAPHALKLAGVVAHRTNLLRPADVDTRGAVRLLKPARLACDLAAFLDDDDLESVIEQMLDRRMVQLGTLRGVARDFMASGRNGTARIARVLDHRPNWRRPVGSDLELRLLRALAVRGLALTTQVRVRLDTGRDVVIDLADPHIKFGVEVDHTTWHGGRLDVQRDKARDRAVMRLGWTIARVTDDDISRRLDITADQLCEIASVIRARSAA